MRKLKLKRAGELVLVKIWREAADLLEIPGITYVEAMRLARKDQVRILLANTKVEGKETAINKLAKIEAETGINEITLKAWFYEKHIGKRKS